MLHWPRGRGDEFSRRLECTPNFSGDDRLGTTILYIYNIEIKSRPNYKIQITEGNIKYCPIIIVHCQNEIVRT